MTRPTNIIPIYHLYWEKKKEKKEIHLVFCDAHPTKCNYPIHMLKRLAK